MRGQTAALLQDRGKPQGGTERRGPQGAADREAPGAGGSGWTWETCGDTRRLRDHLAVPQELEEPPPANLRPDGIPVTCSHESSTGGGAAVVTVDVLMSPMMFRASFRAKYIRSISSRCWA